MQGGNNGRQQGRLSCKRCSSLQAPCLWQQLPLGWAAPLPLITRSAGSALDSTAHSAAAAPAPPSPPGLTLTVMTVPAEESVTTTSEGAEGALHGAARVGSQTACRWQYGHRLPGNAIRCTGSALPGQGPQQRTSIAAPTLAGKALLGSCCCLHCSKAARPADGTILNRRRQACQAINICLACISAS